ncbi:MAG: hypothetical protein J0I08_00340 [Rhizobiales bacterium]|nr:hypothetical protein [Hyphomicrobiales bacterium]
MFMEHSSKNRPPPGDVPNFRVCQKKKYGDINALSKRRNRCNDFELSNDALRSNNVTVMHVIAALVLFIRNASFPEHFAATPFLPIGTRAFRRTETY